MFVGLASGGTTFPARIPGTGEALESTTSSPRSRVPVQVRQHRVTLHSSHACVRPLTVATHIPEMCARTTHRGNLARTHPLQATSDRQPGPMGRAGCSRGARAPWAGRGPKLSARARRHISIEPGAGRWAGVTCARERGRRRNDAEWLPAPRAPCHAPPRTIQPPIFTRRGPSTRAVDKFNPDAAICYHPNQNVVETMNVLKSPIAYLN